MYPRYFLSKILAICFLVLFDSSAFCKLKTESTAKEGRSYGRPASFSGKVADIAFVDVIVAEDVNLARVHREDKERERRGGPYRIAVRKPVQVDVTTGGTWEQIDSETWMWRLHIVSAGATSLSLGFTTYTMPAGGKLFIYSQDGSEVLGPYTERDNARHGQLWTPLIYSDDVVAELTIPLAEVENLELTLGAINHGYRKIPSPLSMDKALGDSDWCEIDVNCSYGDAWRDQIRSVATYYITLADGTFICTGSLVNNTAEDNKPYFLTAFHCFDEYEDGYLSNPNGAAASMVVTWNYQATTCGGGIIEPTQDQSGAYFRAGYLDSDVVLVELDETPACESGVYYAGWDRNSTAPSSGAAIHHPQGDLKKISIEYQPLSVTSDGGISSPGDGTHLRVADWDVGTTEGGSSGSPLFDSAKRIRGQLHGGAAACGNNESDWYGFFNKSWTGGDSSSTRLSDWLDPLNTGAFSLDGKNQNITCRLCEDCEPEDADLGTIGTVAWGYNVSGNCGNGGKWVGQFTGEAGKTYHFDLCPSSPGSGTNSGFDPDIKITNSSCAILAGEDGSCSSPTYSPNNFQWTCPANGTYYVIIAPYNSYNSHTCNGTASNTFTLNYYKEGTARPCGDCEPEDTDLGTIGAAVWGYSASGNCGNGGKWVGQFTGEAGAKYHFDLCPDSPGSGTNNGFDPDIKITNNSCSIIEGQDGSCSLPSYSPNDFQWICPASGTYYVIIAPYNSYNSHTCNGTASNTFTLNYYKEPNNTPPSLSSGQVSPSTGDTSSQFYYYVDYYDADGDAPTTRSVYIDDVPYTMTLYSGSASNGTYQYGPTSLPVGIHVYYFYFEDGRGGTVRLPISDSYTGPTVNAVMHTLTVASSEPNSGVLITVNPLDNGGQGDGVTEFVRVYDEGTVVTLTAPSIADGNGFKEWQHNSAYFTNLLTANVTMDADHILTAVYEPILLGPIDVDWNSDGIPNFYDFRYFSEFWRYASCTSPDWCGGRDLDRDCVVDIDDLQIFAEFWLWPVSDLDLDTKVDFSDYALFTEYWEWTDCEPPDWCYSCDIDKSSAVDIYDLAVFVKYWLASL
jgi:hypothetical protein